MARVKCGLSLVCRSLILRFMKWIARIFGFILILIVLALALGYAIPAHHKLTHTITLKRSPDAIFAVLADLPNMPA